MEHRQHLHQTTLYFYPVMGPRLVAPPIFALGRDKCVSSYQWILQVDWWVDFVYFTNLPFAMVYLYNDNVIQRSFYAAPNFVSRHHLLFQYSRQLYYQVQSEAFFAIDRLFLSPGSFLGFATTFYSVQHPRGGGQTRSDACTPWSNLFPLLLFPVSYSKVGALFLFCWGVACFPIQLLGWCCSSRLPILKAHMHLFL